MVVDLTQGLAEAGLEVHLCAVIDQGVRDHPFLEIVGQDVRCHPLEVPRRAYMFENRELRELFRAVNPDIVHTHGYRENVIGAAAARGIRIPVVSTVHGFTGRSWKIQAFKALERWSFRRADAVIPVSRALGQEVEGMGVSPGLVHVIPNARTLPADAKPPNQAREELGVRGGDFVVGWVGRLGWEKAPDIMVETAALLSARGRVPNLKVIFIGGGEALSALKSRCAELQCESTVRWLGQVPNATKFFRGFDVLAISSRSEGTPIVALEAMALGVPLVATEVGGIPDLTGPESATLVVPDSPKSLARAIEAVFEDREGASTRARLARKRIESLASVEDWVHKHLMVYREVLAARQP